MVRAVSQPLTPRLDNNCNVSLVVKNFFLAVRAAICGNLPDIRHRAVVGRY